jgi:hypothetical protein
MGVSASQNQKEHTILQADEIRSQKMEDWTVAQWGEYMEGKTELK